MGHPLIERLSTELGWPVLTTEEETLTFISRPGFHALFIPGDWQRNLETPDVAVILPEIVTAFQGRFDCAVIADENQDAAKEASGVFKTPSIVFYREGACLGRSDSRPPVLLR